ncbi:PREDICTED: lysozyme-like [Wasmannia auropunctata]|uniref:lysozyme-like n=1 Tax=Wasmannia auropunctata TaxID=64793 RepID=UPI0005ED4A99|nr:PREDICTED: lysozyme-like [Wasmannia auropunctata]
MFAKFSWIAVTIIIVFCVYSSGQQTVSNLCLGCICEASSNCNVSLGCEGPVCGPFLITKQYWIDAGKIDLIRGEPSDNDDDDSYRSCVNDVFCAGLTVQAYMSKFRRDCTGNGIIDCNDYVRLHRFGASGCTKSLHKIYERMYKTCIEVFEKEN